MENMRRGVQTSYRIARREEIPAALAWLEETLTDCPPVCTLICEELLNRLTRDGDREIRLRARLRPRLFVEIRALGEADDPGLISGEDDESRIASEIQTNLLARYARFFEFRYSKGENRYRIDPEAPAGEDLCGELYSFYAEAKEDERNKPLAPLLHLVRKHPVRFALAMAVKALKHLGALMLPVFAANIIDTVVSEGAFFIRPVMLSILYSAAALAVNLICFRIDNILYHRWTRAVEAAYRMAIVQKIQVLSLRFHSTVSTGKLLSKLISDVQFIGLLIYERLTDVLHLGVDIVFVVITALVRFPLMLLFYVVIVPAAVMFIHRASGPVLAGKAVVRTKTEDANAAIKEMLDMNRLTRAQGMQHTEYRKIATKVRRVQDAADRYDELGVWVNNITYGGSQGFRLLCLCFAAFLASRGAISVGTVILFQSVFEMIISSVQKVLDAFPEIVQGYDSLVSVGEILYEQDVEHNGTGQLPEPVRGEIELRDVVFSYAGDRKPVLNGVSLRVPAGESAAFVGKSGAGKSTLLNLILGLYACQGGQILIDGEDINEIDKNSFRRHVAVVPQRTILFSGTLWDNLVYGLSYVSTAQVLEVIRRVGLDDLLSSLPDGLESEILEDGSNLSGGQRQRIAIARALLRKARIILFDEATSALDAESERQVQAAMDEAMKDATVIIVAHRLGTLRKAGRIYRMEDGKVIPYESFEQMLRETGGPEDLLRETVPDGADSGLW